MCHIVRVYRGPWLPEVTVRIAVPAISLAMLAAACGGGDSPFISRQTPSPAVEGASQTPRPELTTRTSGCEPGDYTVEDGDTLAVIADEFGVTIDAIVDESDLDDPDTLAIGQVLQIPCASPTRTPPPSPTP
jgi:LysM repeat protein